MAGVPPDYFNPLGQLWGNPLYDWPAHQAEGYAWWLERLAAQNDLFDVTRIDHFRGFHDYWSIPADHDDAREGVWESGPGSEFFEVVLERFPALPFLAEDLGLLNDGVHALRKSTNLPGMAVLQFAFDGDPANLYLPHNLSQDLVLYTGTHDNDTSLGWYESADEEVRGNFRSYLSVSGEDATVGSFASGLSHGIQLGCRSHAGFTLARLGSSVESPGACIRKLGLENDLRAIRFTIV